MAAKIFIKCFDPTLQIMKSCCRAVPDDRFEVQNYPACMNVGFSLSSMFREEGIWRKGQQIFHPATWQSISSDAGQAAAQSNYK